jgi:hypothetical protein
MRSIGVGLFSAFGGLLLAGGTLLPWLDTGGVNVGTQVVTGTPTGLETSRGVIVLSAGIVAVVAAMVLMSISRVSRIMALVVVATGATGLVGVSMILTNPREAYIDFAADELGVAASDIEHSLESLFEIGGIQDDPAAGIYVSLAGGGVAILSGAIGALILRRRRIQPPPTAEDDIDTEAVRDDHEATRERGLDDAEPSVEVDQDRATEPVDTDSEEEGASDGGAEEQAPHPRKDVLGDSWFG